MRPSGFFLRDDELAGIYKAAADSVDYGVDWTNDLAEGVSVASATWTLPAGLTGGPEGVSSPITKKRISGGVAGTEYPIAVLMTKTNGEELERTFVVIVVEELS